eukprot:COSAG06_NODE_2799_length_6266_cov_19.296596_3_plen_64_part_00
MSSREETLAKIEAGEDAEHAIRDAAPEVQADKAVMLTAVAKDYWARFFPLEVGWMGAPLLRGR